MAYLVGAKGEAASQYIYTSITDNGQDRPSILYVYRLSLCLCTLRFCCVVLCAATPLHKRPLHTKELQRHLKKKLEKVGFDRLRDVCSALSFALSLSMDWIDLSMGLRIFTH